MKSELTDKQREIFCELDEPMDQEDLLNLMEMLDDYTVKPPSEQETENLIAQLKPMLPKPSVIKHEIRQTYSSSVWQLLRPQWMIISKKFIAGTVLSLFVGLFLTNAFDGNTLMFLANSSPVLGILTIFYTFRAQHSGVDELEAACPYSPAQIAAARLLLVLGYDTFLCSMATLAVGSGQGGILWQVVMSWLAPLLFVLGVALATSLRFDTTSGCCVSALAWFLQLKTGKESSVLVYLLPDHSLMFFDCVSLTIGICLIFYSYKRLEAEG